MSSTAVYISPTNKDLIGQAILHRLPSVKLKFYKKDYTREPNHQIFLSKANETKLNNAIRAFKDVSITVSNGDYKSGSGIFDFIKPIAQAFLPHLVNAGANALNNYITKGSGVRGGELQKFYNDKGEVEYIDSNDRDAIEYATFMNWKLADSQPSPVRPHKFPNTDINDNVSITLPDEFYTGEASNRVKSISPPRQKLKSASASFRVKANDGLDQALVPYNKSESNKSKYSNADYRKYIQTTIKKILKSIPTSDSSVNPAIISQLDNIIRSFNNFVEVSNTIPKEKRPRKPRTRESYNLHNVQLHDESINDIVKAYKDGDNRLSVRILKGNPHDFKPHPMYLTQTQIDKINKSKNGIITLQLSKRQIAAQNKEGGFLVPLLASLAGDLLGGLFNKKGNGNEKKKIPLNMLR